MFYAGTATLIFILFRRYIGTQKAAFGSLLYMLNPIALGMSVQPLVHSQFTFFYLLAIYFLLRWSETGDKKFVMLFGIFTGISILTRYTGLSIGLIIVTYIYLLIIAQKIQLKPTDMLKHLLIGAFITFLIF